MVLVSELRSCDGEARRLRVPGMKWTSLKEIGEELTLTEESPSGLQRIAKLTSFCSVAVRTPSILKCWIRR